MFFKLIVLLLIVFVVWYFFKKISDLNFNKKLNGLNREQIENKDVSPCAICGIFVTEGLSNCGIESCPH